MKLVVDTNVFVSAALKEAPWPSMVVRWVERFGGLIKSFATEAQVMEVLQRPYFAPRLSPEYLDRMRQTYSKAELVAITETITACRDPTDNKFLELAVSGRADLIVTGDQDLLVLDPLRHSDYPAVYVRTTRHARLYQSA